MTTYKLDRDKPSQMTKKQKERVHSLTENDINKAARSDPDALPLRARDSKKLVPIPNPQRVRRQLRMSQRVFAKTYRLNLRTLQEWEQGRRAPDASTRILLTLIRSFPDEIKSMVEQSFATTNQ